MSGLIWQIPLIALAVFVIERIIRMPFRAYAELQEAKRLVQEGPPLTLEQVGKRIEKVNTNLHNMISSTQGEVNRLQGNLSDVQKEQIDAGEFRTLRNRIEEIGIDVTGIKASMEDIANGTLLTHDPSGVLADILVTVQRATWEVGGIARTAFFTFGLRNGTDYKIRPTGNTAGYLIAEANRLTGTRWDVTFPGIELNPKSDASLIVVFPINERLAETLAYKPRDGTVNVDFTEMAVELEARDDMSGKKQIIGWLRLLGKEAVRVDDHIAFQQIRAYYNWKGGLQDDPRIQ